MDELTELSQYLEAQRNRLYELAVDRAREFKADNPDTAAWPVITRTRCGVGIRWWCPRYSRKPLLRLNGNRELHKGDFNKIPDNDKPRVAEVEKFFRFLRVQTDRLVKARRKIRDYRRYMGMIDLS